MAKKPAAKTKASQQRVKWLSSAGSPLIDVYAKRLGSFLKAMADGKVDDSEVKDQEARVVRCMKELEPRLDDVAHKRVTRLLCELTAYDLMKVLNAMHNARPKVKFRG